MVTSNWVDWALQESLIRGRQATRIAGERVINLMREVDELEAATHDLRARLLDLHQELDLGSEWHH